MSKAVNLLVRKLFHLPVKDATSGFRCFRGDLLKRLRDAFGDRIVESDGFAASLELLLKAVNSGGIVAEVPIFLDYGKKGGASKMRLFSTIFRYMILLLRHGRVNSSKRFG
jgi:dolichol-phosphate mannosyltransferase